MFARVLLAAAASGCAVEAMAVVAMVSTDNVFHMPRWVRGLGAGCRMAICPGGCGLWEGHMPMAWWIQEERRILSRAGSSKGVSCGAVGCGMFPGGAGSRD